MMHEILHKCAKLVTRKWALRGKNLLINMLLAQNMNSLFLETSKKQIV